MKHIMKRLLPVMVLTPAMWLAGCNGIFGPRTVNGVVVQSGRTLMTVSDEDRQELSAAVGLEKARVNYRFRLGVLCDITKKTGDIRKQIWAERELKNLDDSQVIQWNGLAGFTPPKVGALAAADKAMVVELVVLSRRAYLQAIDDLLSIYQGRQNLAKVKIVQKSLDKFDPIHTYMYFLSAEVPPITLQAIAAVPRADQAFDEAMALSKEGRNWLNKLQDKAGDKNRSALKKLLELIGKYPRSNKIALSAFHIAELYRGFDEDVRASVWYDRAWQWDSELNEPARYRAATLYDFKLGDMPKALQYYRLAVAQGVKSQANLDYAHKRIRELTARKP